MVQTPQSESLLLVTNKIHSPPFPRTTTISWLWVSIACKSNFTPGITLGILVTLGCLRFLSFLLSSSLTFARCRNTWHTTTSTLLGAFLTILKLRTHPVLPITPLLQGSSLLPSTCCRRISMQEPLSHWSPLRPWSRLYWPYTRLPLKWIASPRFCPLLLSPWLQLTLHCWRLQ